MWALMILKASILQLADVIRWFDEYNIIEEKKEKKKEVELNQDFYMKKQKWKNLFEMYKCWFNQCTYEILVSVKLNQRTRSDK